MNFNKVKHSIEINGVVLPLHFGMETLETVIDAMGVEEVPELSTMFNGPMIGRFKLARCAAYYGIKTGCRFEKIEFPWSDIEQFGDELESFHDLTPAVELLAEKIADFFTKRGAASEKPTPTIRKQSKSHKQ